MTSTSTHTPETSEAPHKRLRLGIMGGTFDPIHHGHLVAASEVASELDLDEVVFVPTGQPWQKAGKEVSPAEHRYLMTVIATASNPRFSVSRVDIDRPGPTYTADTLDDLRRLRPEADLFFITGADAMDKIMTWKNVEQLWGKAHFVGVSRPGHTLRDFGRSDISLMEVPAMAISSTDCRRRVKDGKPVWYLVPDGVVQYIAKYGLYKNPQGDGLAEVTPEDHGTNPALTTPGQSQQIPGNETEHTENTEATQNRKNTEDTEEVTTP